MKGKKNVIVYILVLNLHKINVTFFIKSNILKNHFSGCRKCRTAVMVIIRRNPRVSDYYKAEQFHVLQQKSNYNNRISGKINGETFFWLQDQPCGRRCSGPHLQRVRFVIPIWLRRWSSTPTTISCPRQVRQCWHRLISPIREYCLC